MEAVEGRKSKVEGRVDGDDAETRGRGDAERVSFRGAKGDTASWKPAVQSRWREISGITVENERKMSAKERRAGIRKLKAVVEQEIRLELKEAAEEQADRNVCPTVRSERTFLWEPIPAICHRLEIGPTVLSRLMKELTGMSATQMVDKIRAEGIREKLRENLRAHFGRQWHKPGHKQWGVSSFSEFYHDFWARLKSERRFGNFSYTAFAIELGFANYTRFYRGCLLHYGMTPSQLEDAVLREYAEWYELAVELGERVRREAPYQDKWTEAMKERPEFISRMRGELELAEDLWEWVGK